MSLLKKTTILSVLLSLLSIGIYAQRFCYVDTEVVLDQIPGYKEAISKIRNTIEQWEKELKEKQALIDQINKNLINEKVLLTPDQIKKREQEISAKKKELEKSQEKYFDPNDGEAIRLRQQLARPLQDGIYNAITKVAQRKRYAFVFDKAGSLNMLYTDPKFDITIDVLKELGIGKNKE